MNWFKVAAVLTSNFFFVASCTGITFLSAQSLKHVGGKYMARGEAADPRMIVIASIPDAAVPGMRKFEQVWLSNLPKFQSAQPDHTFVIPSGDGEATDVLAGVSTSYRAKPLGAGRVLVETDSFHDVPLGLVVVGSYEATEREVKPLHTNVTSPIGAVFVGLVGALILALIGSIMRWAQRRRNQRDQQRE